LGRADEGSQVIVGCGGILYLVAGKGRRLCPTRSLIR